MEKSEDITLKIESQTNSDLSEITEKNTIDETLNNDGTAGNSEKESIVDEFFGVDSDLNKTIEFENNTKDVVDVTSTLWKYQLIPDEPEPFPEYLTLYNKNNNVEIIGARVRGKKHKHEGTNCDDWFECISGEKMTCIAVSDGAGSKKYSRIGARSACRSAIGYLNATFIKLFQEDNDIIEAISLPIDDVKCIDAYKKIAGVVQQSMLVAYNAVENAFYERFNDEIYSDCIGRKIELKDFASTLLVAVCIPISNISKEKVVVSCQIGDGMVALINSDESYATSLKLMGEADSGDFSGETDFLINNKLLNSTNLASRTKVSRGCADIIMLMSDGVADDYYPNEPEIHRLYLDLVANGIINSSEHALPTELSAKQVEIIKKIPKPIAYPWVNDNSVMVNLNYTNRIMKEVEMSLEELWNNKFIASVASAQVKEELKVDDPSQRLKIWLDNYVERGSFDDRTLVVAKI